jgi:hypothetical protein
MKYTVQVTETINHSYEIEAESEEQAVEKYHTYTDEQLKELDIDGQSSWDAYPWDVEVVE